jgi:hypothetical protein
MPKRKQNRSPNGINSLSWCNPHERDTTRGYVENTFPSMHIDTPRIQLSPVSCKICGLTFSYLPHDSPKPLYCYFHAELMKGLNKRAKERELRMKELEKRKNG